MCLSKYVKVCFIGTIITTVSDVLSLVTRNYPTVCTYTYMFKLKSEQAHELNFSSVFYTLRIVTGLVASTGTRILTFIDVNITLFLI